MCALYMMLLVYVYVLYYIIYGIRMGLDTSKTRTSQAIEDVSQLKEQKMINSYNSEKFDTEIKMTARTTELLHAVE